MGTDSRPTSSFVPEGMAATILYASTANGPLNACARDLGIHLGLCIYVVTESIALLAVVCSAKKIERPGEVSPSVAFPQRLVAH